jgi:hypothetical protein
MAKKELSTSDLNILSSEMIDELINLYNEGKLLDYLEENMTDVEYIIGVQGNLRGFRFCLPYDSFNTFYIDDLGDISLINRYGRSSDARFLPDEIYREISLFFNKKYDSSFDVSLKKYSRPVMSSPGRSMRSANQLSSRRGMARPTGSLRSATRSSDLRRKRK